MARKTPLLNSVYNDLLTGILEGEYKNGESLPPLSLLCEKYNVGLNTMKSALGRLCQAGFIQTGQGKTATVVFDIQLCQNLFEHLPAFIVNPDLLKDYYHTIRILFVPVYVETSLKLNSAQVVNLQEISAQIQGYTSDTMSFVQACVLFFRTFADNLDNSVTYYILKNVMQRTMLPAFLSCSGESGLLPRFSDNASAIETLAQALSSKDPVQMVSLWGGLLDSILDTARYIISRCELPDASFQTDTSLYDELELRHFILASDIRIKILHGQYPVHSYLPALQQLMEQYEASLSTVRNALSLLASMELIQVENGNGSRVTTPYTSTTPQILKDTALIRRDKYIDTLNFLILVCPEALNHLPAEKAHWINQYADIPWNKDEKYTLLLILYYLFYGTGYAAMASIGELCIENLFWGFHSDDIPAFHFTQSENLSLRIQMTDALSSGSKQKSKGVLDAVFNALWPRQQFISPKSP